MKQKWKIKDFIDLEYFLYHEENGGDEPAPEGRAHRDRDIYLKHIEPVVKKEKPLSRSAIIRLWLRHRRIEEKEVHGQDTILPGDAFQEIYRLLFYSLSILGILSGSGLAFSLLAYAGTDPLNISTYMGVFVLMQVLLLLLILCSSLVRFVNPSFFRASIVYSLVGRLLAKLVLRIKRQALKNLSGTQRSSLQAAIGLARGKKQIYGSLFHWPVFILIQVLGTGFNLGVLSATLLRVVGSDIAFGWQSTVRFSSLVVYTLVQFIALPWSWFIPPEIAYPSLDHIEGSRIVLKEGIYHLATQDLVAWWPFLCLSVLFYGLLPRVVLLSVGLIAQNRVARKQDLNYSACVQLIHRMETPLVSTKGRPSASGGEKDPDDSLTTKTITADAQNRIADKNLITLIPDDIFEQCPDDELNEMVYNTLGYQVEKKIRIGGDYEADEAVLEELGREDWGSAVPKILILQEAWQPPIQETLTFIQGLRKALGRRSRIEVALIGRPGPKTIFTPVKEEDWNMWHKKLVTMGDPYLRLERLIRQ